MPNCHHIYHQSTYGHVRVKKITGIYRVYSLMSDKRPFVTHTNSLFFEIIPLNRSVWSHKYI